MSKIVNKYVDMLNLYTVYKFRDLRVYEFIDSSHQNTDFHSLSVFQEKSHLVLNITVVVTCLQNIAETPISKVLSTYLCISNNSQSYSCYGFLLSSALQ